jgi:hypothetical protein
MPHEFIAFIVIFTQGLAEFGKFSSMIVFLAWPLQAWQGS